MALDLEVDNGQENGLGTDRHTLYLLGGIALMIFGAGLIISNPVVRRYMGQMGIGNLTQAALPDVERYLKLPNM
ncbi:MAG TPA: hypothetical protein VGP89_09300 [Candidatus Angelobacter sp.]|nr:hypothetical protein [Candidatus Angelobacter sp.]